MVLDRHDGMAAGNEPAEGLQEPVHVGGVKTGRRLVEQKQNAARRGRPDLQERSELQALRFAARKSGGGLAEREIAQTDLRERRQAPNDRSLVREERHRLVHGHRENVADVLPAVPHGQNPSLEPPPVAGVAPDGDVGQELHVDRLPAGPLAHLAAAARRVEREVARDDPARHGARGPREDLPDLVPRLGVGDRVGPRRSAERALVDEQDVGDELQSLDPVVCPDVQLHGSLEAPCIGVVQDVAHESRLPGSRDPRDRDQAPEREPHRQVLQVVLPRADDRHRSFGAPEGDHAAAPRRPRRNRRAAIRRPRRPRAGKTPSPQELPRRRGLHPRERARRPLEEELSAEAAGAGTQVDDVVRRLDRLGIVLDHDDRVSAVREAPQDREETPRVHCVQADRGLVEHVEGPRQRASERRGETDPLGLSPRKCSRRARERQVLEPDVVHVPDAGTDLRHD